VALADNRPYGGTCAMRGCKPKKYLVAAAEVVELAHQMSTMGIHPVADIDWPALMGSKTAFTSAVPGRTEHDFQQAGIEMFQWHHSILILDRGHVRARQAYRNCHRSASGSTRF
jgi:glutathione reductase (NADPH)